MFAAGNNNIRRVFPSPVQCDSDGALLPRFCKKILDECFSKISQGDVDGSYEAIARLASCRNATPNIRCAKICTAATEYAMESITDFNLG